MAALNPVQRQRRIGTAKKSVRKNWRYYAAGVVTAAAVLGWPVWVYGSDDGLWAWAVFILAVVLWLEIMEVIEATLIRRWLRQFGSGLM